MRRINRYFFIFLLLAGLCFTPPYQVFSQTDWTKLSTNPVLTTGPANSWDELFVECNAVIFQNSIYHMWYSGSDKNWKGNIGYATSTDGIVWQKHINNPVLTPGENGAWDDGVVAGACVMFKDSTFHMWYDGWNKTGSIDAIGYATSTDGINWTKYVGNPVMMQGKTSEWDTLGVGYPNVIFDGVSYKMWYNGKDVDENYKIGYATSLNGVEWTKHINNPILEAGIGKAWDNKWVSDPIVFMDVDTFHMWYRGVNDQNQAKIGYAKSPDETNWQKHIGNPLNLEPGIQGSWDDLSVSRGPVIFVKTDTIFKMWYNGVTLQGGFKGQIGYATSQLITSVEEITPTKSPNNFVLLQNYPNPFNPETEIQFRIPERSQITLAIYNTIGQNIITLTNKNFSAGIYSAKWNGKDQFGNDVPSGIYFYQISTENFKQIKKMTLLR